MKTLQLDLRPDLLSTVRKILLTHVPDYTVWAFGSRVSGTAKETSDLDLCIEGSEPLDLRTLGSLRDAFSASDLPMKVDVVDAATISDAFRAIIDRQKVTLQSAS